MNDREAALRKLSATQFAMWELRMYLDTHPNDPQAITKYEQYELKAMEQKMDYESKYGPLTVKSAGSVEWLDNPWPWEYDKEESN